MNELTKLIEQAFDDEVSAENMFGAMEILCGKEAFIERVNEILATRPTCGKEQRLFLDEVEKLEYGYGFETDVLIKKELSKQPIIFGDEFRGLDLEKVIKGE